MRVPLVDDDAIYQHVLRKALERWGYEVVAATDGNVALAIGSAIGFPIIRYR